MSDKKNVNLQDLEETNAEEVKGGAGLAISTNKAPTNQTASATSPDAARVAKIGGSASSIPDLSGSSAGSTVMCPW
jgi:hypothetical protein